MIGERWRDWSCAVEVTVTDGRDLEVAAQIVRSVMGEVDLSASRFRDDSDLARVNAHAGRLVPVLRLTLTLVELALAAARRTGGAVTPTIGEALVRLGYDDDIAAVMHRAAPPDPVGTPAPAAGEVVRLDHELGRVGVAAGVRLDLGALAKAYAVDEAVRRIAAWTRGGVLVSIGGDLAVHGAPADGWTIAVSERDADPAEHVTIEAGALATSSTVGRRWAADRHHIVDPWTGLCATGSWRTASVWAPSAVEANVLSTWALVDATATERALARDARPARLVSADGTVARRHGWPAVAPPAPEVAAC